MLWFLVPRAFCKVTLDRDEAKLRMKNKIENKLRKPLSNMEMEIDG